MASASLVVESRRRYIREEDVLRPIFDFVVDSGPRLLQRCNLAYISHLHLSRRQLRTGGLQVLDLSERHLVHVFAQMLDILHDRLSRDFHLDLLHSRTRDRGRGDGPLRLAEHLACHERQLVGSLKEYVEGRLELEDRLEDGPAAEDVQT